MNLQLKYDDKIELTFSYIYDIMRSFELKPHEFALVQNSSFRTVDKLAPCKLRSAIQPSDTKL